MNQTATLTTGITARTFAFLFARFFAGFVRWYSASASKNASLETLNIVRTALSNFSAAVFPGTGGAACGFMCFPILMVKSDFAN
jgi:hypothetical protein